MSHSGEKLNISLILSYQRSLVSKGSLSSGIFKIFNHMLTSDDDDDDDDGDDDDNGDDADDDGGDNIDGIKRLLIIWHL